MAYPSELPRTLSKASVRFLALAVLTMRFGVFQLIRFDRQFNMFHASWSKIPATDNLLILSWGESQLSLLQTVWGFWAVALVCFVFLDRGVRSGSGLALAISGAMGIVLHFLNLPYLAWLGIAEAAGIQSSFTLDRLPASFGIQALDPVELVAPFMRVRLDPAAWLTGWTGPELVTWTILSAIWVVTLAISAAALHVGLRSLLSRPLQTAFAAPAAG